MKRVCVYCASSERIDDVYHDAARELGRVLASAGVTVVYGGRPKGSMGAVADAALSAQGQVVGVMPQMMVDEGWHHRGLSELVITADMPERKRRMLEGTDAVVALPGGSGTFEELFETLTAKRLGLYLKPIVLVNTKQYFSRFVSLMDHAVAEGFMDPRHQEMWTVVDQVREVLPSIQKSPVWSESARSFA